MLTQCSLCHSRDIETVYQGPSVPVFQNVTYPDPDSARGVAVGEVVLGRCRDCGFTFNTAFDLSVMKYDQNYQNEQAHSPHFADYLNQIAGEITKAAPPGARVVEVGCGKGAFLELLLRRGLDVYGIDPSYEGDNPRVVKAEFNQESWGGIAEQVILRHVLEHIPDPAAMLRAIAALNDQKGSIYIEVPSLDWILEQGAFWDIFYEHCNYFAEEVLQRLFPGGRVERIFGGQYLGVWAGLANSYRLDRRPDRPAGPSVRDAIGAKLKGLREALEDEGPVLVWGAGAKGSTFVNKLDPDGRFVSAVVDINPRKQGRFIARTGHPVIPPEQIAGRPEKTIYVMNPNYYREIAGLVGSGYRLVAM